MYEYRSLSPKERRQQLLDLLFEGCYERDIALHGWVVLPNHYHLLAFVPRYRALGELFRAVHGRTSHQWNAEEGARGRQVWYRFSDRAMRSESQPTPR